MLPLLELMLPDTGPGMEFFPGNPTQAIDSEEFAAVFTDLLRTPTLAGEADIESPGGQLLPDNGELLPPAPAIPPGLPVPLPPIDGEPQIPLPEPADNLIVSKNEQVRQERARPQIPHPEITHPAHLKTRRDVHTAQESGLRVNRGPGLPRIIAGAPTKAPQPDTRSSTSAPAAQSPIEHTNSPDRRLAGMSPPLDLPMIEVATAKPRAIYTGPQYTGVTAKPVMSPHIQNNYVGETVPRLEPVQLKSSADGRKPSVQQTAALSSTASSGNTAASAAISLPATASVTSLAGGLAPVVTAIDVPVLDPQWGTALNERVTWMANRNIQNAEIRMNPAELGPLRVQVSINDGSAHVIFDAQNAVTREAIELALPRLREMLSENGLLLSNVTVSDQDVNHGQQGVAGESTQERASSDGPVSEADDESRPENARSRAKSGIVDTFV